jgi:hypothetical protein
MKSKSFRFVGYVLKMGKTWITNITFIHSEEVHSDSPKRKRMIKW